MPLRLMEASGRKMLSRILKGRYLVAGNSAFRNGQFWVAGDIDGVLKSFLNLKSISVT